MICQLILIDFAEQVRFELDSEGIMAIYGVETRVGAGNRTDPSKGIE